ncbi:FG-GAP-like repeat-containing protein [Streptomyces sp. NPDC048420]|uniref:FG-GAP-like repeat-containing protein n=1 Tax=Streptomyces sp. NPDC048420 TaxID=3155755 RepID=UPI00341A6024
MSSLARHAAVRLRLVAASAVLAAGLSPLLPSSAVADTAQETVVPATFRDSYTTASVSYAETAYGGEGAGEQGVFHRLEGHSGLVWTRYADGTTVDVPAAGSGLAVDNGTGSDVLARRYQDGRVELFDAADGTTSTLRIPTRYAGVFGGVYGRTVVAIENVTGEDGISTRVLHLLSPGPDGGTRDLTISGLPSGMQIGAPLRGDASGIAFRASLDGTIRSVIVDPETGQVQNWTPALSGGNSALLSPDYLVHYAGDTASKAYVYSRADLSAPPVEVSLDGADGVSPADELSVVGDWLVHHPAGGSKVTAVPIAGGPPITLLADSNARVSASAYGDAVAVGRTGADDWGLQRIHADADGKPIVSMVKALPKPAYKIQGLALEQGRLLVADDSRAGTRDLYLRTVAAAGAPTYGTRSNYDGTDMMLYSCPAAEGGCAVFGTADNRAVWLTRDTATNERIRASGPGAYDFSENYVPAGGRITDVSGQYVIHTTATQQTVLRLGDSSGPKVTRTPGAAALDGELLWTAGSTAGAVTAYNLTTKKTVETVTTDAGCVPTELQALGRYLYWTCDGRAGVYDRTAKKSVPVPAGEAKLGDGFVVTHDKRAGKLTLTTFTDGTAASRVIGDLPDTGTSQRDVRWTVDESGANAAYVDAREQVHLVPSGVAQQPLRLLAPVTKAPSVTAQEIDTTPDTLVSLMLSKPTASSRLTVRSKATGKVVYTRDGGAARGGLDVGWPGTDSNGKVLTDGPYDWTLSVTPADGVGAAPSWTGTVGLIDGRPARHHHVGGSDAVGDLLTQSSSGTLSFHQGTGKGTFTGDIPSRGWASTVKPLPFGDLSGDRCNDILMRLASGALRLYKPGCSAEFKTSTPYTTLGSSGWNQYDVLTYPGDVTGDGRPDLIARGASTGTVYLYKGTSAGKLSARVKLYDNWKTYKKIVGTGDLNGDGIGDLLAQDKSNNLYRYYGKGNGTFSARTKLFTAWGGSYNVVVGVGDITGDGRADLVSRDTGGNVWRNSGDGKGSFGARVKIATGWQGYKGLF